MNKKLFYREESKKDYFTPEKNEGIGLPVGELAVGSLMRIADASEKMVVRHTELIADRDRFERWYHDEMAFRKRLEHRIAGFKGYIKKLEKRV